MNKQLYKLLPFFQTYNELVRLAEYKMQLYHARLYLRALIAGGGAPEIELAVRLSEYSRTLGGMEAYCVRAYADALEVIPSTLAENAGLNPISTVTELRNRHSQGDKMAGINVRKVNIFFIYLVT